MLLLPRPAESKGGDGKMEGKIIILSAKKTYFLFLRIFLYYWARRKKNKKAKK